MLYNLETVSSLSFDCAVSPAFHCSSHLSWDLVSFHSARLHPWHKLNSIVITIDHELLRHQRLHISITILNLLSCKRLFNLELWESARKHWNRAVQWAWKQQTWKKQKIQRILLLVLYFHLEIQLQENEGCAREWAFHRFGRARLLKLVIPLQTLMHEIHMWFPYNTWALVLDFL